ncbi:MAG: ATP-binding protein [bacterium]
MLHPACRLGHSVLYIKTWRLFADLACGRADGISQSCLRTHLKPDSLLLHDLAMKDLSLQQADHIYDLHR